MQTRRTRRRFLQTASLLTTGFLILKDARSARCYQANDKLNIVLVGVGNRGRYHAGAIPRMGQNLAAVCDADQQRVGEVAERLPRVSKYQDFRNRQ